MKSYFGNTVTAVTTIMILVLLGFIGESIANRTNINYWGRRSLFLLAYATNMVLFDVRWSNAEDPCNGSGKNYCQSVIILLC